MPKKSALIMLGVGILNEVLVFFFNYIYKIIKPTFFEFFIFACLPVLITVVMLAYAFLCKIPMRLTLLISFSQIIFIFSLICAIEVSSFGMPLDLLFRERSDVWLVVLLSQLPFILGFSTFVQLLLSGKKEIES